MPLAVAAKLSHWPTPTCQMEKHAVPTQYELNRGSEYARRHLHVAAWSTPTVNVAKNATASQADQERNSPSIAAEAGATASAPLNPAWVTALMGFPPGWLDTDGPQVAAKRSTRTSRRGSPQE